MSRTVDELQRALAEVPGHWLVETTTHGVVCANSPDGFDRMCVMPWPSPDGAYQARRFVRVPPLSDEWPEPSYRPIDVWLDGGRTVAKAGEWEVHAYRNKWRWFIAASDSGAEVKGIANSRYDALGAVVVALWERSVAKLRERLGTDEEVPF